MSMNTIAIILKCPVDDILERHQIVTLPKKDCEEIIGREFVCAKCGREVEMVG